PVPRQMPSVEHQTRPTPIRDLVARNITAIRHKEGAARLSDAPGPVVVHSSKWPVARARGAVGTLSGCCRIGSVAHFEFLEGAANHSRTAAKENMPASPPNMGVPRSYGSSH